MGTIKCRDIFEMLGVCAYCVQQGLKFTAAAETLTVTLTGGH